MSTILYRIELDATPAEEGLDSFVDFVNLGRQAVQGLKGDITGLEEALQGVLGIFSNTTAQTAQLRSAVQATTADVANLTQATLREVEATQQMAAADQQAARAKLSLADAIRRATEEQKQQAAAERAALSEQASMGNLRFAATGNQLFLPPAALDLQPLKDFRLEVVELNRTFLTGLWAAESMFGAQLGAWTQGLLALNSGLNLVVANVVRATEAETAGAAATAGLTAKVGGLAAVFASLNLGMVIGSVAALASGLILVYESLKQFTSMEKDLSVTGNALGMNAQEMGAFGLAARAAGIDSANFIRAIDQMSRDIVQVEDGLARGKAVSNDMTHALDALGVSLVDDSGKAKTTFQVIVELADAIKRQTDEAKANGTANEAAGRAMEILGRFGGNLVPVFTQGSASIKEYLAILQGLGVGTEEQTEKFHQLEAASTRMHVTIQAVFATMGADMVPVVSALEQAISKVAEAIAHVDPGLRAAAVGAVAVAGALGVATVAFIALNAAIGPIGWAIIATGAVAAAAGIFAMSQSADQAKDHISSASDQATRDLDRIRQAAKEVTNQLADMAKQPSTEELSLSADIDATKAKIAELNAEILRTGAGGEEVASLTKHLDDLVKSGARVTEVTDAQEKLAYAIRNNANPAAAEQVSETQHQIDVLQDQVKLLTAQKDVYTNQRQAIESWIKSNKEGAKSIEDIRDELAKWIELQDQAGGDTRAAKDLLAELNRTIASSKDEIHTAGQTVGESFQAGVASGIQDNKADVQSAIDMSVQDGAADTQKTMSDAGHDAGTSWWDGFKNAVVGSLTDFFAHPLEHLDKSTQLPEGGFSPQTIMKTADGRIITKDETINAAGGAGDVYGPAIPPVTPVPTGVPTSAAASSVSVVQIPDKDKPAKVVQTAIGEFLAAADDAGDVVSQAMGNLGQRAMDALGAGVRTGQGPAGRELYGALQQLVQQGAQAGLPNLAEEFDRVKQAAIEALEERTPEAAQAAGDAIQAFAHKIEQAQLAQKITSEVQTGVEKITQLVGDPDTGIEGSFERAMDKSRQQVDESLDQIAEDMRDKEWDQAGKTVVDKLVRGFQDELKSEDLADKLSDEIKSFTEKAQSELDNFFDQYGDSQLRRLQEFNKTMSQGVALSDQWDPKKVAQLNAENEVRQREQRLADEKARIDAAALAKKLIDEAQAKDKAMQDEVDKYNQQTTNADRVAAYRAALEQALGIDAETKDKQRTDKQVQSIQRRAAEETKQRALEAEQELQNDDQRMQRFFQMQTIKNHIELSADPEQAIADALADWNTHLQSAMDYLDGIYQQASAVADQFRDVRDSTGNGVENIQDMINRASTLANSVSIPAASGPQAHVQGSAVSSILPQLQSLIGRAYPGGTPFDFANRYMQGTPEGDVIRNLAGPSPAGRAAAPAGAHESDMMSTMKNINDHLSKPLTVELNDSSARRIQEALSNTPIEITVVLDGREITHQVTRNQINHMERRRSVSGVP